MLKKNILWFKTFCKFSFGLFFYSLFRLEYSVQDRISDFGNCAKPVRYVALQLSFEFCSPYLFHALSFSFDRVLWIYCNHSWSALFNVFVFCLWFSKKLPRVPETLLKKRKRNEELRAKFAKAKLENKKVSLDMSE